MKKLLLASVIVISPSLVLASSFSDVYIRGEAGYSALKTKNHSLSITEKHEEPSLTGFGSNDSSLWVGGVSVGVDLLNVTNQPIRLELNYIQREDFEDNFIKLINNEIKSENKFKSKSLMLNAFYDFKLESNLIPYIGVGVGYSKLENELKLNALMSHNGLGLNTKKTDLSWSLMAGVRYPYGDNVSFGLGYRYMNLGKINESKMIDQDKRGRSEIEAVSNDILFSISYKF